MRLNATGIRCRRGENWAVVGMMYVAETEELARQEVASGLADFFRYHHVVTQQLLWTPDENLDVDTMVDRVNESGTGLIGTPDMAIAHIERTIKQTGGFGEFLFYGNEWGNRDSMLRMYELFARQVMPYFDDSRQPRISSFNYYVDHHDELMGRMQSGWKQAREAYERERADR